MILRIDADRCAGHGVCYGEFPGLFYDDEAGYGQVAGDGLVAADRENEARLAVVRCPERAVTAEA